MLDVSEISKKIVIEKPTVLSLLGKGMLTAHVRRKLEAEVLPPIRERVPVE